MNRAATRSYRKQQDRHQHPQRANQYRQKECVCVSAEHQVRSVPLTTISVQQSQQRRVNGDHNERKIFDIVDAPFVHDLHLLF